MTPTQRLVLDAYLKLSEAHGAAPSGPALADEVGLHVTTVYYQLDQLERSGLLERVGTRGRSYVLTAEGRGALGLGWPLLGQVPAGPLGGIAEDVRWVHGLEDLLGLRAGDFLLEVRGDSMNRLGIEDGMMAVLRPGAATPGAICALWVDGEGGTLKEVYPQEDGSVRLVPRSTNPRHRPVVIPAEQVRVQGRLIRVLGIKSFGS